ncbi:uncharacterized protein METZ01_LOCUS99186 [marine metagenome]|uniref:Uncharacterized protein n=1 Tax=marine metagenome TaxID=408172 RepID=A0A381W1I4_9ZZZZ
MVIFLLTTLVIGAAMLVMAVGVLLSNRCLRGSCGGPEFLSADGESLLCETCPNRDKVSSTELSA